MRRFPWDILLALVVGIGLGLVYTWMIHPKAVTDADPSTLRTDFKEQYRSVIAAAFAANKILPRAEGRLQLLKDSDPVEALNAQAQQMLARGEFRPSSRPGRSAGAGCSRRTGGKKSGIESLPTSGCKRRRDIRSQYLPPLIRTYLCTHRNSICPHRVNPAAIGFLHPAPNQDSAPHPAGTLQARRTGGGMRPQSAGWTAADPGHRLQSKANTRNGDRYYLGER